MNYTTKNCETSIFLSLASRLRDGGYDVLWHESGVEEAHTSALPESLGRVTLVEAMPANPAHIIVLNSGTPEEHEVAIPAFCVRVSNPKKIRLVELGGDRWYRERDLMVDGFTSSPEEQKTLADLLFDWMDEDLDRFTIMDYEDDPGAPTPLPVVAWTVEGEEFVENMELASETYPAIRYYVKATNRFRYIE